jgi:serine acetyltransferase
MIEKRQIALESAKGATKGGLVAAAGSILSGIAMVSAPVKILGLITVGSSVAVSAPVVLSVATGGAIVGATAAAFFSYRKQRSIEREFRRMTRADNEASA